ncbi:hypothetical protein MNBD_GAMMA25-1844 [hydrothermal vent metagenome]|uniref:Cytochrome C n=1 Tax=hydrothermal vent metagenome TaxID=652676 RepID=A0A3B1B4K9_9ZZZZ
MCKLSWSISGLLFVVLIIMGYKFIIAGSVVPAADGREALLLKTGERDMILSEMRIFLASVQAITDGLSNDDMNKVAEAARVVGAAAQQDVPASLIGKLPLSFKKLGFDTHRKFDMIALDAEQLGDPEHTLKQLAELMNNCVACHATYRFDTEQVGG